jgi:lipopolysaccharide transport system permease protein
MNLALLLTFTRQDLLDRYSASLLGGLWTLINPLVQILIFTLIFSKIMGARLGGLGVAFEEYSYSVYLVPALLGWFAFGNTLTRVSTIYQDKAGLIGKVNLSLQGLPLYVVLSETVIYLLSMVFFALFLLAIGFPITAAWWYLPLIYAVQQLFAFALGFGAAVIGVFVRDVIELVRITVQIWFWLTPIVYVLDILPDETRRWFAWNPMAHVVTGYRDVVLYGQRPDLLAIGGVALLGLGLLLLARFGFRKLEKDLRDFI